VKTLVDLKQLGTKNWRSYALFRAAIDCSAAADHQSAEQLLVDALKADGNHLAAVVNFASELMGLEADTEFAVRQFERALERLEKNDSRYLDPVYYATLYRLTSAYYDLQRPEDALKKAEKLYADLAKARKHLQNADRVARTNLFEYIRQIRPAAVMLVIGLRIELRNATIEELRKSAARFATSSAQAQYNFACGLVAYAGKLHGEKRTTILAEARQYRDLAIRMKPSLRARAKVDRSLALLQELEEPPANGS
jgi:tetratricopeptide (TPR) repeat protein